MRILDAVLIPFKNLFRSKVRTILTIVSMMVGAFLISIMMSVGNGLENFLVSQVTMFSNDRTISVRKQVDSFGPVNFGGVQEYQEPEQQEQQDSDSQQDQDGSTKELQSGNLQQQGFPSGVTQESDIQNQEQESESVYDEYLSERQLDKEDLEKIKEIDHIETAIMSSIFEPDYLQYDEEKKLTASVISMPEELIKELNLYILEEDMLEEDRFIVVSQTYAEEWGEEPEDLIGEEIQLSVTKREQTSSDRETKIFNFQVAGITEKGLLSSMVFSSPEASNEVNAYIYGKDVEEYSENEKAFEIQVIVEDNQYVQEVDEKIEDLGYESDTYEESIGQIDVVFDVINLVLSGFGIVALVVASIGIANILLMAVYERTREIGVMKAVGATRGNITVLFTLEAAWLGFWGGVFGVVVSWLIGRAINYVLHEGINIFGIINFAGPLVDYPSFDVSVFNIGLILLVIAVTTVVATVAGLYPAWRASKLDPIEALRSE